jgi:hypothetical protein
VCVCFLFCDSMLRFEFAACDFLISLSTVVFVVVVVVLFPLFLARETECKREKKILFNALADEQLLLQLKELLFISFRILPEWGVCCEVVCELFRYIFGFSAE